MSWTKAKRCFIHLLIGWMCIIGMEQAACALTYIYLIKSGSWHTASNWDLNRVPTSSDDYTWIHNNLSATISSTTPAYGYAVYVGGGTSSKVSQSDGYLYLSAGTAKYEVFYSGRYGGSGYFQMESGTYLMCDDIHVGQYGMGTFTQNGGTVIGKDDTCVSDIHIGGSVSTSTYNLYSGLLSVYSMQIGTTAGYAGYKGAFNQTGGTVTFKHRITMASGYGVSSGPGQGSYSISGTAVLTGEQILTEGGIATITQSGSSTVTLSETLWLASSLPDTSACGSTYQLQGGTLSAADEYIGNVGLGVFTQTAGLHSASSGIYLGYYSGSTGTYNLNGGTLVTPSLLAGSGTAIFKFGGGILQTGAGFSSNLPMTLSGTATLNTQNYSASLSGVLSGSGGLVKTGAGTLTLSGSNTYSGPTTISAGVLAYNANNVLAGGSVTVNGGTLNLCSYGDSVGAVALNSGAIFSGTLTSTSGFAVSSGSIGSTLAGSVSLTKTSDGTVTLSGANTYSGTTSIKSGTLLLANKDALAGSTLDYGNYGGSLSFGKLTAALFGGLKGAQNLPLTNNSSGGIALSVGGNGTNTTYSGLLTGGGGLTKNGSGTLTLSGTNTYTGLTTVKAGVLKLLGTNTATPGAWNPVLNLGGADIQAGKLVFDYATNGGTSPASTIQTLLKASYDGSKFASGQIFSSTAGTTTYGLGWFDDGSAVTVKIAVYGDADLSGTVGASDLSTVLTNFGLAGTWSTGDFDYSGVVGASDLSTVLTNFGQTLPASLNISPYHLDADAIGVLTGAGITVVPEPGMLVLLAAVLAGLIAYAWRKRK
jgi:fibronectin-binding autotransporter adhesin